MSAIASDSHSAKFNTDWRRSAGDFSCTGKCRRKRLPASAFSKTQVRKAIAGIRAPGADGAKRALCLQCSNNSNARTINTKTANEMDEEVGAVGIASIVHAEQAPNGGENDANDAPQLLLHCAACDADLPDSAFSKSQKTRISRKKPGRCLVCVEAAEEVELQRAAEKRATEAIGLAARMLKADGKGAVGVANRLALACAETAAEAEVITGLTAKRCTGRRRRVGKIGGSRGGRGRGRWRGGKS